MNVEVSYITEFNQFRLSQLRTAYAEFENNLHAQVKGSVLNFLRVTQTGKEDRTA